MSWDYIPVIDLQISEDGGLGLEGVSGVSFTDPGLLSARHRQTRICVDLTVILRKICRDERCADGTAPVSLPACLEPASSTALRANDQWHFSASTTPPSAAQQISLILAFKFQRQSTDVSLIPEPSTLRTWRKHNHCQLLFTATPPVSRSHDEQFRCLGGERGARRVIVSGCVCQRARLPRGEGVPCAEGVLSSAAARHGMMTMARKNLLCMSRSRCVLCSPCRHGTPSWATSWPSRP
jgi:hypothetical protein